MTISRWGPEPERAAQDDRARQPARASELATQKCLLRLWRPSPLPGKWRAKELAGQATGR